MTKAERKAILKEIVDLPKSVVGSPVMEQKTIETKAEAVPLRANILYQAADWFDKSTNIFNWTQHEVARRLRDMADESD